MDGDSRAARLLRSVPLLVFLIVLAVRASYWAALEADALSSWHLWRETDEHGFVRWSAALASGNWLDIPAWRAWASWQSAFGSPADWERWYPKNAYFQGPLYPYALAVCWKLFGSPFLPARLFQLVLACLASALVAKATETVLARRDSAERLAGSAEAVDAAPSVATAMTAAPSVAAAVAGLVYGLYAPSLFHDGFLYRDGPVAHLSTVLLLWPFVRRAGPAVESFGFGLLGGLAVLLKQTLLPVSIAGLWLLVRRRDRRSRALGAMALALPILALVLRNLHAGAPPLAFDTRQTISLVWGTAQGADGTNTPSPLLAKILNEADGSTGKAMRLVLESYRGRFGDLVILEGKKLATFLHEYEIPDNASFYFFRDRLPWLAFLPVFTCVLGVGVAGLLGGAATRLLDRAEVVALSIGLLAPLASCLLVSTVSRYRLALLGPLALGLGLFVALVVRERRLPLIVAAAAFTVPPLLPSTIPAPRHRFADTLVYATLLEAEGQGERAAREVERYLREGTDDNQRQTGLVGMRLWWEGNREIAKVEPEGVAPPEKRVGRKTKGGV